MNVARRILGVDPGLRITGYGAIAFDGERATVLEAGVIAPDRNETLERRLGVLHRELCAVVAAVRPDVMVVEELWTAYRNPTTAVLMGHARGVLCLAAESHGIPVRHLAHAAVKRALAGSGAATKLQVKRMVMVQLGLRRRPEPDDVSDALALALALSNVERVELALEPRRRQPQIRAPRRSAAAQAAALAALAKRGMRTAK